MTTTPPHKESIKDFIRNVPDFPKPGIMFKDVTPLLGNAHWLNRAIRDMIDPAWHGKIDKVVGIEARGFIFGSLVAAKLQAGFVPIRKVGKLPYNPIKILYGTEYSKDAMEMHPDAFQPGDRVLLVDDVLATGGTADAARLLVEKGDAQVVAASFLMELSFLSGRKMLEKSIDPLQIKSVLVY